MDGGSERAVREGGEVIKIGPENEICSSVDSILAMRVQECTPFSDFRAAFEMVDVAERHAAGPALQEA